jgi:hypothetical protein
MEVDPCNQESKVERKISGDEERPEAAVVLDIKMGIIRGLGLCKDCVLIKADVIARVGCFVDYLT